MKWVVLSLRQTLQRVDNWLVFLCHFLSPYHGPLEVRFKDGAILSVPDWYLCETIVETILSDSYGFGGAMNSGVVVDVGASVGDFALRAHRSGASRIYCFEPNTELFGYLQRNMVANSPNHIRAFNVPAGPNTLSFVLQDCGEPSIDFLKIDCEGCEYPLLMNCPPVLLSRVKRIGMEIHHSETCSRHQLVNRLTIAGFKVQATDDSYIKATYAAP
jgi:hypothetical protein